MAGTLVSSALYNQLGSMKEVNLGNGLRTLFNYHGIDAVDDADPENYWGRLYRIKTLPQAGGTALLHQKYWWDDNGNLATREDEVAAETERFSYDNLDRLVGVTGLYTESFSYDVLGNMMSKNGTSYTYGGVQPHAVTSVGAYTQDYDANGNMVSRANATGTQTLAWNVENLLSQVDRTGGGYSGTATYVYDGDWKRIKKTEGWSTNVYPGRYYEKSMTTHCRGLLLTYRRKRRSSLSRTMRWATALAVTTQTSSKSFLLLNLTHWCELRRPFSALRFGGAPERQPEALSAW